MEYYVYVGIEKNKIVYVGTTIQKPSARFSWHKSNGKNFNFQVLKQCKTEDEMFNLEVELINNLKPIYNKKTTKHNLNVKLTKNELNKRKGNKEWCQVCLKRRVNEGYTNCKWC